jgi:S1-C subfamily serine protease
MQPQLETSGNSQTGHAFKKKRRVGGLAWILIGIALLFVLGWVMSAVRKQQPATPRVAESAARSFFGVNEFSDVKEGGGVTFNEVYPPGSPADKAELLGGDIITHFDGRTLKDKAEIENLLRQTPTGKTVEIAYLRDGETRKTRLTTISQEQFSQLEEAFDERGGGKGQLGFDEGNTRVVPISGTKLSGVQLNSLSSSGPAALAGIQEGDVIIEFDGVRIRTLGELVMRVWRAIPYSTVKVVVMRGPDRHEIPVKMGKRR